MKNKENIKALNNFMKTKNLLIFVALLLILPVFSINAYAASSTVQKVKGRILLQVESKGEAYYVDPTDLKTHFLGKPDDAFSVMRKLGLGISEKDFNSFDGKAPGRLSGRILLRVESSGEAYYVDPVDLKMNYLGRPSDAFKIMRTLGLGITDKDLEEVKNYKLYQGAEGTSLFENKNCIIKGNVNYNTGEKIYHLPHCDYYDETIIDENYGEKWFCSEQEAIKLGWRKALNCNAPADLSLFIYNEMKNNRVHFLLNTDLKWSQLNNREKSIFLALNNGMDIEEARQNLKNLLRSPLSDLMDLNKSGLDSTNNIKIIEEALYD